MKNREKIKAHLKKYGEIYVGGAIFTVGVGMLIYGVRTSNKQVDISSMLNRLRRTNDQIKDMQLSHAFVPKGQYFAAVAAEVADAMAPGQTFADIPLTAVKTSIIYGPAVVFRNDLTQEIVAVFPH